MPVPNNSLLAPRHWAKIIEAGAALALASAATRLLPFKRFIGLGALPVRRSKPLDTRDLARIMEALGRRMPFRALCLQQGIAFQWMLRRRGVDAVLHYGMLLPQGGGDMLAHVWVSVDGEVLLGLGERDGYTEVARCP